ncbi:MAG: radical SAM protein [Parvularculaceae bacterium]
MRVYLADLGHNLITKTSDVYPLGVANLAAYAKANATSKSPLQFEIFREPQELKEAIDKAAPDVLGLSSYSWNHRLALAFARYLKRRRPQSLTLMGGPNFPLTRGEQEEWMRTMPEIDAHVRGPTYESEIAFLNLIQRYADVGGSIEGLLTEPVDGNQWIDPKSGEFVIGAEVQRIRDLDEIPSPYTTGLMDKFFNTGYFALMQIARGCPFTCQFCNSSPRSNSKAFRHSFENIKADLDYIVARIQPEGPLCFADDNFGMYEEDEEVADYLGHLMDKHDWPKYIRTTTGKNKGERIIRVMKKARGRLPMTSAVQSLNPTVLKNIQRQNISLDTYAEIQEELHRQGMQSYGELILCMPGETKLSFMEAVDRLIETGVSRISAHQLMLLHGAPLSDPDQRAKFGFKTRHRIVARCIGEYADESVIETEEMVVETPDFTFDEYLETRVFHLLLTIYYYEDNFGEAFRLARELGFRPFQVIERMQRRLKEAPAPFQKAIADYVAENEAELFSTRDECVAWAVKNYDLLVKGELGGNLLSKYSMIGRFIILHEALDFLQSTIESLIDDDEHPGANDMLAAVIDYYRSIMLHVPFAQSVDETPEWWSQYDIASWRKDDFARPLADYRLASKQSFPTAVDPTTRSLILSRIATFGEHPQGLGRFTRTLFAQDLRRKISVDGASSGTAA